MDKTRMLRIILGMHACLILGYYLANSVCELFVLTFCHPTDCVS